MSGTKVTPPADQPNCPQCGTPLPSGALTGLCPACLLKMGAQTDTVTDGRQPGFTPPAIAELAPLFPQLEILEFIGKGGMGAVYKARQKQLDRVVALKILPPGIGADPAFAERFTREARALAKLNHPGIVTLYEFGQVQNADGARLWSQTQPQHGTTHEGVGNIESAAAGASHTTALLYFFLMEFVDGVNLRQLLHAGRVSAREALAIVPQICDALQFAHDQGIVHRDIKPENILLDRRGRVKVADFGLAKIVGSDAPLAPSLSPSDGERVAKPGEGSPVLTDAGKVMGTPQYMSPEQRENPSEVDHRADIYALGVVFYQMLTGELPGKKIEPPSKKVQIDVRLDEIVLRALEKDPERRYGQASVLKTQVETVASGPECSQPAKNKAAPRKHRLWAMLFFVAGTCAFINAAFFGSRFLNGSVDHNLFKALLWLIGSVGFCVAGARNFSAAKSKNGRQGNEPETQSAADSRDENRWQLITYGLVASMIGLPIGLVLNLPLVWGLSIAGIIIGVIKLRALDQNIVSPKTGGRWVQRACFGAGIFLFSMGMWKVTQFDLKPHELFFGVLLVCILAFSAVALGFLARPVPPTSADPTSAIPPISPPKNSATARIWTWVGIVNMELFAVFLVWFATGKSFSLPIAIFVAFVIATIFDLIVMRRPGKSVGVSREIFWGNVAMTILISGIFLALVLWQASFQRSIVIAVLSGTFLISWILSLLSWRIASKNPAEAWRRSPTIPGKGGFRKNWRQHLANWWVRQIKNQVWELPLALAVMLAIFTFLLANLQIQSDAAGPEIPRGSYVIANRLARQFSPGDMVAYRHETGNRIARVASAGPINGALQIVRRDTPAESIPAESIIGKIIFNTRGSTARIETKRNAQALRETQTPMFAGLLKDGSFVELVSLMYGPGSNPRRTQGETTNLIDFWKPDGTRNTEYGRWSFGPSQLSSARDPELEYRGIVAHWGGPVTNNVRLMDWHWDKDDQVDASGMFSVTPKQGESADNWLGLVQGFPSGKKTATLRFALASGPYVEGSTMKTNFLWSSATPWGSYSIGKTFDHNSNIAVTLTHNLKECDYRLSIQFDTSPKPKSALGGIIWEMQQEFRRDERYKKIIGRMMKAGTGSGQKLETWEFPGIPAGARLSRIDFEVRPVQWVEFQNVALNPGKPTQVAIQVNNSAQAPEKGATAFGPVTEFILRDPSESRTNCFVDFESGRLVVPPADLVLTNRAAVFAWAKTEGVDAIANTSQREVRGLLGYGLTAVRLADEEWERPTEGKLGGEISKQRWNNSRFGGLPDDAQMVLTVNIVSTDPQPSKTYGFRTSQGTQGLLQFLEYTDSPRGWVKIRYKLMQSPEKN